MDRDAALRNYNRGVERLAEFCTQNDAKKLYRYMSDLSMPVSMLAGFEHACGATYVAEYLAAQAHLLAVEMPRGRALKQMDVADLQAGFADATGLLIRFYQGKAGAEETLAALTEVMGGLGWHRANVQKAPAPELDLFGDAA